MHKRSYLAKSVWPIWRLWQPFSFLGLLFGTQPIRFQVEYENQNTDFDTDILVDAQMGFNVGLIKT